MNSPPYGWTARHQTEFVERGFTVISQLFTRSEVDVLRRELQRYINDVVPGLPRMDVLYDTLGDARTIKMLPRMEHHDNYFADLLRRGRLFAIADATLPGDAVPQDAAFFNKPAAIGSPTPPHQDGFYFHLAPCHAVTVWVAIDDVDERNGCLRYLPGSHRDGLRHHERTSTIGFSQGITDYGNHSEADHEVAVSMQPGDAVVHDALTIHRADPNQDPDRSRPALGFVYFSSLSAVDEAARDAYQRRLSKEWEAEGKI